jgi:hypothetical protein
VAMVCALDAVHDEHVNVEEEEKNGLKMVVRGGVRSSLADGENEV